MYDKIPCVMNVNGLCIEDVHVFDLQEGNDIQSVFSVYLCNLLINELYYARSIHTANYLLSDVILLFICVISVIQHAIPTCNV